MTAICTAMVVAVATLLPYVKLGPISRSGLDTSDGKVTLVLAIIGVLALAFGRGKRWSLIVQFLAATLVVVMAVADMADIKDKGLEVGSGLWLILIAGIAWTLASLALLVARRRIWPAPASVEMPGSPADPQ